MTEIIETVREHYRAIGLTERLKTALAVFGPEDQPLSPLQLANLDHFHTRGMAATAELAKLAGLHAGLSVLDVGCGIGGPARFLAESCGCQVTGVDLSEPFIEAARYLTQRTGQTGHVSFRAASALALPFAEASFDAVLLQHVAMNILDRGLLYGEIRRVLKPGGRFATFDVVEKAGDPHYPVPWARDPGASFLLSAERTRETIGEAGFTPLAWIDETGAAKEWVGKLRESGPPPMPNLGVVMGPDFVQYVANLGRNLMEGRLGVVTGLFEAA
jgi:ubiquinone/menaquinone biosynthesis C-methylase UbiE